MMHTTPRKLALLALSALLLIAPVAAASNTTAYNALTAAGPYNILVSLGLEYNVPLDWAYLFYNMIGVGLLYFTMSMASQRNMRFFSILVPVIAGLLAYFGWFNNQGIPSFNIWSTIIATGLIGYGIYVKDANRERYGSGGPGMTLLNFVFYLILLQACIGLVNGSNIWQDNTAPTPTQYQNVDLQGQVDGISNTGGMMGTIISDAVLLLKIGIMAFQLIISILVTVAAFSVVLIWTFPFLAGSPLAIAVLIVLQVVVWLLYAWFYFVMTYKPPVIDQIGV